MLSAYKDKVIVEIETDEFKAKNGIFMPTKALSREMMKKSNVRIIDHEYTNHIREGTVVSAGKGVDIKEGARVTLNRHDGVEFDYEKKHYIGIDAKWIICVTS